MANFLVSPTADEPTHDVLLEKDGVQVALIAVVGNPGGGYEHDLRGLDKEPANQLSFRTTSSPGTRYSSFERPYSYSEQVTWNNGRGEKYATDTPSTFYDSMNAHTLNAGQVVPAGLMTYGQGYRNQDMVMPGSMGWQAVKDAADSGPAYWARSFSASASYSCVKGTLPVRRVGSPANDLTIELCSDNSGAPGTVLKTFTVTKATHVTDWITVWPKCVWSSAQSLTASTTYWIKAYSTGGTDNDYWMLGVNPTTAGTTKSSANGSSWSAASVGMYFRLTDADVKRRWHLFEYRGLLYTVTEPENASSAPQVFRNGWRGACDDNSGDKSRLMDSDQTGWTTAKLAGAVAKIWDGPGYNDDPNFRRISTAGSGYADTTEDDWYTTHTTAGEYVIRGSDWWTEVTGHGMTKPVRSVTAPGNVIYCALGNGSYIRRWGEYNNAGTWTARTWTDDSTNEADFLASRTDNRDGVQIIRGLNKDAGGSVSVSRANVKEWGEDLQFGVPTPLGNDKHKITGMADGEEFMFVITESACYAVDRDSMDKVVDFQAFTGPNNGKASTFSSPYVYFSLGRGGFERLLEKNMEDIGLWRLEGWPSNRQGTYSCAIGHPQYIFCAVDAGKDGYSAIYVWNGGWHEIFRAPEAGQRIRSLYYEVVDGTAIDRLWIGMDSDLCWVPMSNVLHPYSDSEFRYTYEAVITSSWIDDNARDMEKYFKNMKIFAEDLSSDEQYIEWDYQVDDAKDTDVWVRGTGTFDTSPAETLDVKLECKRFRYRLRIYTTDYTIAPKLISVTLSLITNVPPKWKINLTWMVEEEDGMSRDLNGDDDGQSFLGIVNQLNEWASHPSPATLSCVDADLDGIEVLIQPAPRRPLYATTDGSVHIGTLSLQEA